MRLGADVLVGHRQDRFEIVDLVATEDLLVARHGVTPFESIGRTQVARQNEIVNESAHLDGVVHVDVLRRAAQVRQRDPRHPLGEPGGEIDRKERLERRRDQLGGRSQHRALALEREEREQHLGLVGGDEGERRMADQRRGRGGDDRRDRFAEGRGPVGCGAQLAAEGGDLPVDERAEQLLLAGEVAVDRGARAPGLAGDVVERRLGHADPPDARQGRVEDADGLGRELGSHHMRQSRIERLIVNVSPVTPRRDCNETAGYGPFRCTQMPPRRSVPTRSRTWSGSSRSQRPGAPMRERIERARYSAARSGSSPGRSRPASASRRR